MNTETRNGPSTEAQVDRPWIPETRPVVIRRGIDRGRHGGQVRGLQRVRTVSLNALMSGW